MRQKISPQFSKPGYVAFALIATACATVFAAINSDGPLPGIGHVPLLPVVVISALALLPLVTSIQSRLAKSSDKERTANLAFLCCLGAVLSLPAILIDLVMPFPQTLNIPLPEALLFYPAIALVAEVSFHLLPLAVLPTIVARHPSSPWVFLPALAAEPLFQFALNTGAAMQGWLVLGNVGLISAVQIWLFLRLGPGAMIALRLIYYLLWHVLWGSLRLALLF